jgi:2-hydroxy-3-keto-5-methylthiopentenyl-1-phosphate phosphatase
VLGGLSRYIIVLDFDGTVAEDDVQQTIMDHFADKSAWRAINSAWAAGEMTTEMRSRRQWDLIDASEAELLEFIQTRRLDPGIKDFVTFCEAAGYPVHIVSDGFDFYVAPLLAREGLDNIPVSVNSLHFDGNVRHMKFLHQRSPDQYYGNDKTFVIEQLRQPGVAIAYAGDGFSDRAAAHVADLLFAKSKLALYCAEQGLPFVPFDTFYDIQAYFASMTSGSIGVSNRYDEPGGA